MPVGGVVLKKLSPTAPGAKLKAVGGTWDPQSKLWRLPISMIRKLKLGDRVVPEAA